MKKIVLYPNAERDKGLKRTMAVYDMLRDNRNVNSVIITPEFSLSEIEEAIKDAVMIITFGGDGTILRAARSAAKLGVPILGINTGNIGFMAELERDNIRLVLNAVDGKCDVENRMMLDTEVIRNGEVVYSDFSMNDVVVSGKARLLHLLVKGDGRVITELAGDGVVIATPTGSTAYSMAAGGPIMEPLAENIIVTPICAYELSAKSFVLVPERVVEVELTDKDNRSSYIACDGGESFDLKSGDVIRIHRSQYVTKLIRVTDTSFYEKVAQKLRK